MKTILLLLALLIVGSAVAAPLFAPTNVAAPPSVVTTNIVATPNIVVQPVVERVESWLKVDEDFLAGALAVIVALLGVWGKMKSKRATESEAITGVLIHEIQKIATKEIKDNIASAARDAGVSDSLHAAVKANTTSSTPVAPAPAPSTPVNPTSVQP